MSRLTEYANMRINDIERYIKYNKREQEQEFFANKELELFKKAKSILDLEQEIGCSLENIIPLLLAYKQGYVYTKDIEEKEVKEEIISQVGLTTDKEWCLMTRKGFVLDKDYAKTWWLKENLEE